MSRPRFTDGRGRYRTADESRKPGYLERRLKAYARLQRMKSRPVSINVAPIRKVSNG